MTANDDRIDARDWSLLAVLSVLWGGSFFFNGVVLKELPPLTVVLLRVALAAIILLPVLRAYQIRFPVGLSGWKPFFAIARRRCWPKSSSGPESCSGPAAAW